ncbi:MAG: endonuclease/exonuclease/phosphatase family protein [Methyloceanibacter sp.]|uniref:endonuclease/exonuclease/phosphatase family protein n=1 Tax=Methyloceanibacter sp. TaxID=1965321 RepID=UPI003D6CCEB5
MSKFLRAIVAVGLAFGAGLVGLGLLANWYPALDILNNGLPFLAAGALALLALAFATRGRALICTSAILLAVSLALLLTGLPGRAPDASEGSVRFLRVATFNLWGKNGQADTVLKFVDETGADVLVLQEVRGQHAAFLDALGATYPHRAGGGTIVILSKHPILADGRIDREGYPPWISLLVRWVRLDVDGREIDLAGVHLARPFYPELQNADIVNLAAFALSRPGHLILAGDFNMTPWTWQLKKFTRATKLGRFNTFCPTWPMRWRDLPLVPLFPIDNVFASRHFASLGVTVGPRLGSDHRPVIADIALID